MMKFHKVFQAYNAFIRHSDLSPAPGNPVSKGNQANQKLYPAWNHPLWTIEMDTPQTASLCEQSRNQRTDSIRVPASISPR